MCVNRKASYASSMVELSSEVGRVDVAHRRGKIIRDEFMISLLYIYAVYQIIYIYMGRAVVLCGSCLSKN